MKRLLTVLCLLVATTAYAQPNLVNIGFGGNSCGQWLTVQTEDNGTKFPMAAWVHGYTYGQAMLSRGMLVNAIVKKQHVAPESVTLDSLQQVTHTASGGTIDVPDFDALVHWLTWYCREHPLVNIATAADALTAELIAKQ